MGLLMFLRLNVLVVMGIVAAQRGSQRGTVRDFEGRVSDAQLPFVC